MLVWVYIFAFSCSIYNHVSATEIYTLVYTCTCSCTCAGGICLLLKFIPVARCTVEGDVRLMGRSTTHEGRVEVCVSEDWGTVCDHSFGPVDAGVVCYQLGFSRNSEKH